MAKLHIPDSLYSGFTKLLNLSKEDVQVIANLLDDFEVSSGSSDLTRLLGNSGIHDIKDISQVVFSFGYLLIENKDTLAIARSLLSSYSEKVDSSINPLDDQFIEKIKVVLDHSNNLMLGHKALILYTSVKNTFKGSAIITDIRPIFHDDVFHEQKYAVLTQQLKIAYTEDSTEKSIYVNMDLNDLEALRNQIDRAIDKQKNLTEKCADTFTFIDFNG